MKASSSRPLARPGHDPDRHLQRDADPVLAPDSPSSRNAIRQPNPNRKYAASPAAAAVTMSGRAYPCRRAGHGPEPAPSDLHAAVEQDQGQSDGDRTSTVTWDRPASRGETFAAAAAASRKNAGEPQPLGDRLDSAATMITTAAARIIAPNDTTPLTNNIVTRYSWA